MVINIGMFVKLKIGYIFKYERKNRKICTI